MSSDQQLRAVVERIEMLVEEFAGCPDPATGNKARELVHLLMRLYGAALARMLQIVEHQEGAERTVGALLGDDLVASLLVLHDLHPEDAEARIRRGLERLQTRVGARIELIEVRDGVARVKVEDERRAAARLDLRRLIEESLGAVAPGVEVVEIEGLPAPAAPPLIQIRRRPPADRPGEVRIS